MDAGVREMCHSVCKCADVLLHLKVYRTVFFQVFVKMRISEALSSRFAIFHDSHLFCTVMCGVFMLSLLVGWSGAGKWSERRRKDMDMTRASWLWTAFLATSNQNLTFSACPSPREVKAVNCKCSSSFSHCLGWVL